MKKLIFTFLLIIPIISFAQKATISAPILPKGELLSGISSDQAIALLNNWSIDTLIVKNLKWDQKVVDTIEILLSKTSDTPTVLATHKKLIDFYSFHKKSDLVDRSEKVIQQIRLSEIEENGKKLELRNDSLKRKIMEMQSKDAFNQELIGQSKGEQELWFFVTLVVAGLLVLMVILYFLKGGKAEKEIVYREKKVIVHEPAPAPAADYAADELQARITELEKQYKTSLQTIQFQDGEKIERNAQVAEVIQYLREAQGDLKKIQENKTMTAEDFMRLSNAVQRSISKLS
jgi:hypothetical protein